MSRAAAWIRYLLRSARRRISLFPWLILLFALYISLAVVIPPMQEPLRALGLEFPALTHYEISGTVRQVGTGKPVAAVRVSVGGYSGTTDQAGRYDFKFSSATSQQIAVVMNDNGAISTYTVSAGPDDTVELNEAVK